ncbi:hypothetical protein KEM56_004677 [Ascosphaera pollenicola]|nr:hypothetical protein KEM56_004677 [Ascosphaera pollenicola]
MFRQVAVRSWSKTPAVANRSFSTAAVRMGDGDTGAPRNTGSRSGDAWTQKEAAQENLYVRQKEMEKLAALKEKLQQQRAHLDELEEHM